MVDFVKEWFAERIHEREFSVWAVASPRIGRHPTEPNSRIAPASSTLIYWAATTGASCHLAFKAEILLPDKLPVPLTKLLMLFNES